MKIEKTKIQIPKDVIQKLDEAIMNEEKLHWQPWQTEVIKKYYGKLTVQKIGEVLGKTRTTLQARITKMKSAGEL